MKTVKNNLLALANEGYFDVIIQGCNCFHTFGAGLAAQIKKNFPRAYSADLLTSYGKKEKLGQISTALISRRLFGDMDDPNSRDKIHNFVIVNGYTQFSMGVGRHVDYGALRQVFKTVKKTFSGKRIGYPMIGAGLAGGDWSIISKIIDEELEGEDHTFVIYEE